MSFIGIQCVILAHRRTRADFLKRNSPRTGSWEWARSRGNRFRPRRTLGRPIERAPDSRSGTTPENWDISTLAPTGATSGRLQAVKELTNRAETVRRKVLAPHLGKFGVVSPERWWI